MDQNAFRQLVSAPSTSSSSSSGPARSFGKTAKRASGALSQTRPSDLQSKSKARAASGYVDRAAARRSGTLSREFSDVEALHQDFEARLAAATSDEERARLRDQLSSVGGDARYSVLVKGLDHALLAQNRAKLDADARGDAGRDDELEQAFRAERRARSRDEIVQAIQTKRAARAEQSDAQRAGLSNGFRPIGQPREQESATDKAGYKWKDGKRMRRKQRPQQPPEEASTRSTPPRAQDAGRKPPSRHPKEAHNASEVEREPTSTTPAPLEDTGSQEEEVPQRQQEPAEDDESDDDIFADVGRWTGLPDADADAAAEAEADEASVPPVSAISAPTISAIPAESTEPTEADIPATAELDSASLPAAKQEQEPASAPEPPLDPPPLAEFEAEARPAAGGGVGRTRSKWETLDAAPRKKKRKSRS